MLQITKESLLPYIERLKLRFWTGKHYKHFLPKAVVYFRGLEFK